MATNMKEALTDASYSIIKNLVCKPEDVKIGILLTTKMILIQVQAHKGDYGKIIGKKGATISALVKILNTVKNAKFPDDTRKVRLELLEDERFIPSKRSLHTFGSTNSSGSSNEDDEDI